MTYYLRGTTLEDLPSGVVPDLVYPDINDLRNYAIIYTYPNGDTEQILRTSNLRFHIQAFKLLYSKSKYFPLFLSKKDVKEREHVEMDEKLVQNGVMVLYYIPPNFDVEEEYGLLYLPENPTDIQKDFIRKKMLYFEAYPDFAIGQYDSSLEAILEICSFDKEEALRLLKQMVFENVQGHYHR